MDSWSMMARGRFARGTLCSSLSSFKPPQSLNRRRSSHQLSTSTSNLYVSGHAGLSPANPLRAWTNGPLRESFPTPSSPPSNPDP